MFSPTPPMARSLSSHSELPSSYLPIPDGPFSPADPPRHVTKKVLLISSGLLMLLLSLVTFNAYYPHSSGDGDHASLTPTTPDDFEFSVPSSMSKPFSRGVSLGVSEKSSWMLKSSNGESYPWSNSMLSWQRTAYHFQPEKNWMNGNFLLFLLLCLFLLF